MSTETTPTLAALDPGKWRAVREAGVSRASMGVQALGGELLTRLHRGRHDAGRVAAGVEALRAAGFPLVRHNVFFSRDYQREFDEIGRDELPSESNTPLRSTGCAPTCLRSMRMRCSCSVSKVKPRWRRSVMLQQLPTLSPCPCARSWRPQR